MRDIIKAMVNHLGTKATNLLAARSLLLAVFFLLPSLHILGGESSVGAESAVDDPVPYLTTNQPLTLVSANDGRIMVQRDSRGLFDQTRT